MAAIADAPLGGVSPHQLEYTMKKLILTAAALIVSAMPAMAQQTTVSGTRDTVLSGGSAFNFTLKEVPGQNFCIPYASTGAGPAVPGGADAINQWVNTVQNHTNLSFTDAGETGICATPGSHAVRGVGSNN
jgi:hypothetical protein